MELEANKLAAAAQRGDQNAAAQLVEIFYKRVYAFLRRLAGNDADAADLTQRTFGRVWQALPSFAGRSSISSWVHSIAYHVFVDWRRANAHIEPRSIEWWAAQADTEATPDEVTLHKDAAQALYAAVDRLETDLRHTVHLHYYQELTLQDTADAMGVALSTVKYRLRQAIAVLEKDFRPDITSFKSPMASPIV